MRRGVWILLTACFVTLLVAGCWNPFGTNGDGNKKDPIQFNRESPDNLVAFYADKYERKDSDGCEESLHDSFLFQFTPEVAEIIGLPADEPWWGKTRDLESTENMFDAVTVTDINMDMGDPTWTLTQEVREDITFQDCRLARVSPIIQVEVIEEGKEPTILQVDRSWLDIVVITDPNDPKLWQILRINEYEIPE
jgi:hypothetical protein